MEFRLPSRLEGSRVRSTSIRYAALSVAALAAVGIAVALAVLDVDEYHRRGRWRERRQGHLARRLRRDGRLAAAAKKEKARSTSSLPPDWANYGEAIKGFTAKYGIPHHVRPAGWLERGRDLHGATAQGQSKAPDVFDLGSAVAMANTGMFAPYQVATWKDILDNAKDPGRLGLRLRRLHVGRV